MTSFDKNKVVNMKIVKLRWIDEQKESFKISKNDLDFYGALLTFLLEQHKD